VEHRILDDGTLICKAARGEEIVSSLTALLEEKNIRAAQVSGIGACEEAEIGFFDPETKAYEKQLLREPLEVLSLSGNASRTEDGKTFLHLHVVLGDRRMAARGGHLFKLAAEPTLEIFVRPLKGVIERAMIPEIGLRLWKLALILAVLAFCAPAARAQLPPPPLEVGCRSQLDALSLELTVSWIQAQDVMTREQARALVKKKLAGSGVPDSYVDRIFADPRTAVIDAVSDRFGRPPAESAPYEQYRKYFLTEANIADGAQFLRDHAPLLLQVNARTGVDGALLAALTGVETRYGTNAGTFPIFSALYTIVRKVAKRSDWAAREEAELLKLCWKQGVDPHSILGSYAGAFGFVQFMPSSFNAYAVDFDGDGRTRLDEWPDALGSAANYLIGHGYDGTAAFDPGSAIGRSIYAYNHSENYVRAMLELRAEILKRRP